MTILAASKAANALLQRSEYRNAKRVSIFLSMEGKEISTSSIVKHALSNGKKVFVPYIHKAGGETPPKSIMDMLELSSWEDFQSLEKDKWGIPTLSSATLSDRENVFGGHGLSQDEETLRNKGCGEIEVGAEENALDLIVVPAVAFDHGFYRLGHGKGYYDTFFSRCKNQIVNGTLHRMPALGSYTPKSLLYQSCLPVYLLI